MRSEEFKDHVNKHIISALSGYILHLECKQFLWLLDSLCHQSKIQTPNLAPVSLMRFFGHASVHSDTCSPPPPSPQCFTHMELSLFLHPLCLQASLLYLL